MSKGDKVRVTYAVGATAVVEEITAERNGSKVEIQTIKPNDAFVEIQELDKNSNTVRTVRYAKLNVIAIAEVPKR